MLVTSYNWRQRLTQRLTEVVTSATTIIQDSFLLLLLVLFALLLTTPPRQFKVQSYDDGFHCFIHTEQTLDDALWRSRKVSYLEREEKTREGS